MLTYTYPAGKPAPTSARSLPWTTQEIAKLARAFLDLDLDGADLHRWCRKNGIDRSPGAIDKKLYDLKFFDDTAPRVVRPPKNDTHKILEWHKEEAARNLRNQIMLAKLELAGGGIAPYKPGAMEW